MATSWKPDCKRLKCWGRSVNVYLSEGPITTARLEGTTLFTSDLSMIFSRCVRRAIRIFLWRDPTQSGHIYDFGTLRFIPVIFVYEGNWKKSFDDLLGVVLLFLFVLYIIQQLLLHQHNDAPGYERLSELPDKTRCKYRDWPALYRVIWAHFRRLNCIKI